MIICHCLLYCIVETITICGEEEMGHEVVVEVEEEEEGVG